MVPEGHKPQIGCYMSPADAAKLSAYAADLGVKRPLLVLLLVLRELNCQRLPALRHHYPYESMKKGRGRITARLNERSVKEAFMAHIGKFDMGPDEAAWILFQAELSEKWLEKSLQNGNQS